MVAFALSQRGEAGQAEVVLDGIPRENEAGRPMLDIVHDTVENTIRSIPPQRRKDMEVVREAVRRGVRSAVENAWGKRPITKILITRAPR